MQKLPMVKIFRAAVVKKLLRDFLVVQWLRLHVPNAGSSWVPSLVRTLVRTKDLYATLKIKILHATTKIPCASTKTWCSQII